jgi:S-adenosylmethionine hydrolase
LAQVEVRRVIHATQTRYFRQPVSRTFHGRDVFAPLAAWLSLGTQSREMGPSVDDYQRLDLPRPDVDAAAELIGEVIYQDRFGNLTTNIGERLATEIWGAAPWHGLEASLETSMIRGLSSHYAERAPQELGLIINSWGLFEVFATNASAARLTGAVEGSPVRIRRAGCEREQTPIG